MYILNLSILIVVIVMLIVLFIMLFKKNKGMAIAVFTFIFALCMIIILLYNTVFYNNSDKVTIKNGNDMSISINVDNHLLKYEYTFAQFSSNLNFDEFKNVIKSQYNDAFFDEELDQIVFTDCNMVFTIKLYEHSKFLFSDRYKYRFSANIVGFESNLGHIDVPFPIEAIDESVEVFDYEMKLKCEYEKIKRYYNSFTNVEFDDNAIILTYEKYNILLTVSNANVLSIKIISH